MEPLRLVDCASGSGTRRAAGGPRPGILRTPKISTATQGKARKAGKPSTTSLAAKRVSWQQGTGIVQVREYVPEEGFDREALRRPCHTKRYRAYQDLAPEMRKKLRQIDSRFSRQPVRTALTRVMLRAEPVLWWLHDLPSNVADFFARR